jgi:hypothetical protein
VSVHTIVPPVARPEVIDHIAVMADRTCKPDADLKRLWRTLLGGTPFPVCGTDDVSDAAPVGPTVMSNGPQNDAEPRRKRAVIRR